MKRKIVTTIILFVLSMSLVCSLFFSAQLEIFFKLQPYMKGIKRDSFAVHFIDVGQGDAIAIRFPNNKTMLVDSGPIQSRNNLKEYLDKVFFKDDYDAFDYVFLTHSDIDHSGNMEYILENYEVGSFYRPYIYSANIESDYNGYKVDNISYDNILKTIDEKKIPTYFATDGATIDVGCGSIEIFAYSQMENLSKTNDFSPTLIVSCNNSKICLSGDIGDNVEKDLLERNIISDIDIYKLSHHGSKYSNTLDFINKLQPEHVVCSVGDNTFNHPSSETLLRLAEYDRLNGKNTYDTFKTTLKDGNVIYYVNKSEAINVVSIADIGDYLFARWYFIVIVGEVLLIIGMCVVLIPKKRININIHMKNMKA